MIYRGNVKAFGWFKGLPYRDVEELCIEDFDEYRTYKNKISKDSVIKHIESMDPALATCISKDIFTGEYIEAGMYVDGDFRFPTDFLHYYKRHDIGIPYEYEDYLVNQLHIK